MDNGIDLAFVNVELPPFYPKPAEAIGITGTRISRIGTNSEIKRKMSTQTDLVDCQGCVILPGFVDAHAHFARMGLRESRWIDLGFASSKYDVLSKIQEEASKREPGEWIIGYNWDDSNWAGEEKRLTKEELDQISPVNPITLKRVDGHSSYVNSNALEELDLDTSLKGFKTKEGEPIGKLTEEASSEIYRNLEPDVEGQMKGIQFAIEKAHSLGVTSVHDIHIDKKKFRAYQKLDEKAQLDMRVTGYFDENQLDAMVKLGLRSGFGNNRFKIGGVKLFADGSIGSKTAWVRKQYENDPGNTGTPIKDLQVLRGKIKKAHCNEIQVAIHAIGDCAIHNVIDVFETLQKRNHKRLRHRIEHCEMIDDQDIQRMSELGLVASMQPNFTGRWGQPGGTYEKRLGANKFRELNPLSVIVSEDIPLGLGSDCMPFDPFYGVHWAVNAKFSNQQLSSSEAIQGYTQGGVYAGFFEQETGSLKVGKFADLVVLDQDPFKEPGKIKGMSPLLTIYNGEIVYRAPRF